MCLGTMNTVSEVYLLVNLLVIVNNYTVYITVCSVYSLIYNIKTHDGISRHTIVCRAAQEAGAPHGEYINRKKENAIFTPM